MIDAATLCDSITRTKALLTVVLERLDRHRGLFPEDLAAEVIARREEVIPRILEILEDVDRNPEPWLVDEGRP